MIDLRRWLDDLGLGQYADLFANNHIDLENLSNVDDVNLETLGIPFEHRKKLIKAIAEHGVMP